MAMQYLILAAVLAAANALSGHVYCNDGESLFDGVCYKVVYKDDANNYRRPKEMETACEAMGMKLASIPSADVNKKLVEDTKAADFGPAVIGIRHFSTIQGELWYHDASKSTYRNFVSGFVEKATTLGSCAALTKNYTWTNVQCENDDPDSTVKYSFLCYRTAPERSQCDPGKEYYIDWLYTVIKSPGYPDAYYKTVGSPCVYLLRTYDEKTDINRFVDVPYRFKIYFDDNNLANDDSIQIYNGWTPDDYYLEHKITRTNAQPFYITETNMTRIEFTGNSQGRWRIIVSRTRDSPTPRDTDSSAGTPPTQPTGDNATTKSSSRTWFSIPLILAVSFALMHCIS